MWLREPCSQEKITGGRSCFVEVLYRGRRKDGHGRGRALGLWTDTRRQRSVIRLGNEEQLHALGVRPDDENDVGSACEKLQKFILTIMQVFKGRWEGEVEA